MNYLHSRAARYLYVIPSKEGIQTGSPPCAGMTNISQQSFEELSHLGKLLYFY